MKFIEKYTAWITAAILGIVAITFSALFFVTKNNLNNLEKATDHLYGGKQIRIIAFTGEDDASTENIDERVKIMDEIYTTNKSQKTLDDLLKTNTSQFRFTNDPTFGLYLSGVKNTSTNEFVDSVSATNYWNIATPTYYNDTGDSQYKSTDFLTWTSGVNWDKTRYIGTSTLAGASGLHLFQNQIFSLNLTAVMNFPG